MAIGGKPVVQLVGEAEGDAEGEGEAYLLHGLPPAKKEPHPLHDLAVRTKEVLVAKSVVEEVRRRLMHFRPGGESKAEKEKEKHAHEKEAELKVEEKSRAAAWAWYQHGNSGALPSGPLNARGAPSCNGARKASRFKTEALKVGNNSGRVEPHWDFETSLFDSYELDSVSKQIDHAFQENLKPMPHAPTLPPQKLTRSNSLRVSFPRSLCRSISDVVTHEEMALGLRKAECSKERSRRTGGGGWSFRRISRAIHVLMHVNAWDLQTPEQHQLHRHEHHHHHHQHEHEHHHHHHYSVRLKDGSHYETPAARGLQPLRRRTCEWWLCC